MVKQAKQSSGVDERASGGRAHTTTNPTVTSTSTTGGSSLVPKSSAKPSTPLAATSFNAYEYFWRNNNTTTYVDQEYSNLKGNKCDYLVPFIKWWKGNRRFLLYWQSHCISTS
ncbi:hypothetical protein LIER_26017 [Lithospermum erythrorhizon]|uniref:Uncharacterized protein n=1 Tax=Lithospermum erythrorhizon TaxID=34254 RepID=A0AAV3R8E2_LITER